MNRWFRDNDIALRPNHNFFLTRLFEKLKKNCLLIKKKNAVITKMLSPFLIFIGFEL